MGKRAKRHTRRRRKERRKELKELADEMTKKKYTKDGSNVLVLKPKETNDPT